MLLKTSRFVWSTCAVGLVWLALPAALTAQSPVVATIGKQEITSQDLEARTAAKINAEQREYELRVRQLSLSHERSRREYQEHELTALVDEQVLALEAKSRKTTADALLAGARAAEISDAQIQAFYDSQRTQINQPLELIAPQIRAYLQKGAAEAARRQYLGALRTKYHAQITLEPLRTHIDGIGPERGPADAPVTIVEFSDFQCPFCGRFEPVVNQVMAQYPGHVRLIYRNFPLTTMHPNAQKAAEAAQCARDQGKFWEMHDLLFAEQTSLSVDALKEKSRRIGLDTNAFNDCLDSGKARDAIAADVRAGDELGITGTPANFVNGRFAGGAVTEIELKELIEDELRRVGGANSPPSASLSQ